MKRTLHQGWTVRAVGGDVPAELEGRAIPATVPGCVHTDLLNAGLIPDPYLDLNEDALAWVGRVDWRYETTVDVEPPATDRVDLVALGLDTVATVDLNGAVVAETANMHRSYRIPVGDRLRPGANRLGVTFAAGEPAAARASERIGPRPYVSDYPFNAIRKMACNYGWDWGPVLITAGLWRPLLVHTWGTARIAAVRPLVEVDDGGTGIVHAHVELERVAEQALTLQVSVGEQVRQVEVSTGATALTVDVRVPDAQLWWPRGYGAQPLYPVAVVLLDPAEPTATPLDEWRGRVGFRTVSLDTTPDVDGTPFALSVNGTAVFARGVNWIPDDCFPSRITAQRYAERLDQAAAANVNFIRVWGGGIYESDDFYDRCDELGLLVWQDFPFACAAYAEEEPLASEVVAEAREAVTRLSPHPSLAVWNGNNENIWGFEDWGWRDELTGQTWGWGYYTDVLPGIVAELDPTRPYSPGCPYSFSPDLHPNDDRHGTTHLWDVWNEKDYTVYADHRPRFVSEFGWQGPPAWSTLSRAVHDRPLTPDSPGVLAHQKAADGQGKLSRGLARHLPEPEVVDGEGFDDWHWAMSLNQARAVRFGVEHLRSLSPYCQGAVVWQLNDCWPVSSWAVVDGDGRRKPVWYALRDAFTDRLLTFQPRENGLALVAVNDAPTPWTGTVVASRYAFDGTLLAGAALPIDLAPRSTMTLPLPDDVSRTGDPARELLLAQQGDRRTWRRFAEDRDAALPPAELAVEVTAVDDGYRLDVTAETLVVDLAVLADRAAADAETDQMLRTLLPGEQTRIHVRTTAELSQAQLTDPLVLRSANQLVAVRTGRGEERNRGLDGARRDGSNGQQPAGLGQPVGVSTAGE